MGNDSNPVKLTVSATTTLGSRFLMGVCINKTLVGTMTIQEGATVHANFAIGTAAGMYHTIPNGGNYTNLQFVLSGADDVTVYVKIK